MPSFIIESLQTKVQTGEEGISGARCSFYILVYNM